MAGRNRSSFIVFKKIKRVFWNIHRTLLSYDIIKWDVYFSSGIGVTINILYAAIRTIKKIHAQTNTLQRMEPNNLVAFIDPNDESTLYVSKGVMEKNKIQEG